MASYFRWLWSSTSVTPQNGTQLGLPASWYCSPELYELERRAIFSQKWMLITHKNRFEKSGDYLRFTQAGFAFFLCLNQQGQIHGFHNICRHRGFPLLHEDTGNVKILACKYHGWSYGVSGKLAKAPQFERLPGFQKAENGLLGVHVHIDKLGFIWVNLDAAEVPTIPWEKQFPGIDAQERFKPFNFAEYKYHHSWDQQADCNWKTLSDNYNECLHCRTAHPDTNGLVEIDAYRVEGEEGSLKHFNKRQEDGINEGKVQIASTYYYPNACMTVSPHFFYQMRCVPISATSCSMEYDVYRHKDASDEDFERINQMFKRILAEDKWLCNHTQKNLNAGVYVNGPMHSQFESGPLYFQALVKKDVMEHRRHENLLNKQIWPATRRAAIVESKEEEFCSGLSCDSESQAMLEW